MVATGQAPVNGVVELTRATLPAPAAIAMVPVVTSAVNVAPTAPPDASWTSRYLPGCSSPKLPRLVTDQVVPDGADAYCTDQFETLMAVEPRLKISMKSRLYVAPPLPPPP